MWLLFGVSKQALELLLLAFRLMRKNARKAQRKRNFMCPTGMGVLAGEGIIVELVWTNMDQHGRDSQLQ